LKSSEEEERDKPARGEKKKDPLGLKSANPLSKKELQNSRVKSTEREEIQMDGRAGEEFVYAMRKGQIVRLQSVTRVGGTERGEPRDNSDRLSSRETRGTLDNRAGSR